MPPDPQKLAQLQALAQGGTPGLAAYQQAQAQAGQVRSEALAQAGGFGSTNYNPGIGGTLAATTDRIAAPGMQAVEQGAAAEGYLSGLDSQAAANYETRERGNLQSELARARAKIDLENQQNEQERSLAQQKLALQREGALADHQLGLEELALKRLEVDRQKAEEAQAKLLDPQAVAGEAMVRQEKAQNKANWEGKVQQGVGSLVSGIGAAMQQQNDQQKSSLEEQIAKARVETAQPGVDDQVRRVLDMLSGGTNPDPQPISATAATPAGVRAQSREEALGQTTAGTPFLNSDAALRLDEADARNRLNDLIAQRDGQPSLVEQLAAARAQSDALVQMKQAEGLAAELDLPRFARDVAIERGMDPVEALGTYPQVDLETEARKQKREDQQNRLADVSLANQEQNVIDAAEQDRKNREYMSAAEQIGWDPRDIKSTVEEMNLTLPDVIERVSSDAWKEVEALSKGANLTQKEGENAGEVYTREAFEQDLQDSLAAGEIDLATAVMAQKRFGRLFFANESDGL